MRLFLYAALVSGFFPLLLLALKRMPRTAAAPLICLIAAGTVYEMLFTLILEKETSLWFSIYDVLSLLAIVYFFQQVLGFKKNTYLTVLIAVFTCLQLLALLRLLPMNIPFDTITLIFTTCMVIAGSILWFRKILSTPKMVQLLQVPEFYYISGLLLYHTATFLLFLLNRILTELETEDQRELWVVNVGATLIFRLLLTTGIWKTSLK